VYITVGLFPSITTSSVILTELVVDTYSYMHSMSHLVPCANQS